MCGEQWDDFHSVESDENHSDDEERLSEVHKPSHDEMITVFDTLRRYAATTNVSDYFFSNTQNMNFEYLLAAKKNLKQKSIIDYFEKI